MSTYVVGDVQGCYKEFEKLLEKVHFSSTDQLWLVGDLVNRGPDSLGVLRKVHALKDQAIVVLGNHDLHLLAVDAGLRALRSDDTLQAVLDAPDKETLLSWLRYQPLLHHDEYFQVVMTHAGLPPSWDLETAKKCAHEVELILQSEDYSALFENMYGNEPSVWSPTLTGWERIRYIINALTRMRFCGLNGALNFSEIGPLGSQPSYLFPWFDLPNPRPEDLTIVFGHWAALDGVTHRSNCIALDTGCVWGKKLSAIRLDDRQWFSVNSDERGIET